MPNRQGEKRGGVARMLGASAACAGLWWAIAAPCGAQDNDKPGPSAPSPSAAITIPPAPAQPAAGDKSLPKPNQGYLGKLVILHTTLTPAYGQGGEKKYPLTIGTVLQVHDERLVDGTLYLQTRGGVLRAQDVLLLETAVEQLSQQIATAAEQQQPAGKLLHLRGLVYHKQGKFDRAGEDFTRAIVDATPPPAESLLARAEARIEAHKPDEALADCADLLAANPQSAPALTLRAWAYYSLQKYDDAAKSAASAVESDPGYDLAYLIRGWIADARGETAAAMADFEKVLQLNPLSAAARNSLAWIKATSPEAKFYDPSNALKLAQAACDWDAYRNHAFLDTLATCQAANGDFAAAIKTQTAAIAAAPAREQADLQARLKLFQERRAYRK
ncbi:MAG: tetratricopeptide repeat protein [Pirellulales bacterium]|nr:tetratricopeptide repeat protein [Pirellulales bacterium]